GSVLLRSIERAITLGHAVGQEEGRQVDELLDLLRARLEITAPPALWPTRTTGSDRLSRNAITRSACASSVTVSGGEPSMPPDGRSRAVARCPTSSSPVTILYPHQAPCHAPWIRTKCFPSPRRAVDRTAPAGRGVAEALTAAAKATPRKPRRDNFRSAMAPGRYHAVVPGSTPRRPLHRGAKSRASYSVCRTATAGGCSSTGCPRPIEEPTKESNHALVYLCRKRS